MWPNLTLEFEGSATHQVSFRVRVLDLLGLWFGQKIDHPQKIQKRNASIVWSICHLRSLKVLDLAGLRSASPPIVYTRFVFMDICYLVPSRFRSHTLSLSCPRSIHQVHKNFFFRTYCLGSIYQKHNNCSCMFCPFALPEGDRALGLPREAHRRHCSGRGQGCVRVQRDRQGRNRR